MSTATVAWERGCIGLEQRSGYSETVVVWDTVNFGELIWKAIDEGFREGTEVSDMFDVRRHIDDAGGERVMGMTVCVTNSNGVDPKRL